MAQQSDTKIQISSLRKPVSYLNVCKRLLKEHGEIQLSGLGQAISSVVTLTEILKNKKLAVEKSIATAVENLEDKDTGKIRQKPKLVVALVKGPEFDVVMVQEEKDAAERAAKRAAAEAAANGEEEEEEKAEA